MKVIPKKPYAPGTPLCACCKEVSHDFVPDRDLDAFVCKDCAVQLSHAEARLSLAGIIGCVKEP